MCEGAGVEATLHALFLAACLGVVVEYRLREPQPDRGVSDWALILSRFVARRPLRVIAAVGGYCAFLGVLAFVDVECGGWRPLRLDASEARGACSGYSRSRQRHRYLEAAGLKHRRLSSSGVVEDLKLFYAARPRPGNVIVDKSIIDARNLERKIVSHNKFDDHCWTTYRSSGPDRYCADAAASNVSKTEMYFSITDRDDFRRWAEKYLLETLEAASTKDTRVCWLNHDINDYEVEVAVWHDGVLAIAALAFVYVAMIVHTRSPFLATVAMGQILISVPVGLYLHRAVFGFEVTYVLNFLGLFIIAGIGCDDSFLIFDVFKHELDRGVARSAASFFANAVSTLPAIRSFGVFCGTLILVNWALDVTVFPACLVLRSRFLESSPAAVVVEGQDDVAVASSVELVTRDSGEADLVAEDVHVRPDDENPLRPAPGAWGRVSVVVATPYDLGEAFAKFKSWAAVDQCFGKTLPRSVRRFHRPILVLCAGLLALAATGAVLKTEADDEPPRFFLKSHNLGLVYDLEDDYFASTTRSASFSKRGTADVDAFVLETCRLAKATDSLRVRARNTVCVLEIFESEFLEPRGMALPLSPRDFERHLNTFAKSRVLLDGASIDHWVGFDCDTGDVLCDVAWLRDRFTLADREDSDVADRSKLFKKWRDFLDDRGDARPEGVSKPIMASEDEVMTSLEANIVRSSVIAALVSVACAFGCVLLLTRALFHTCLILAVVVWEMALLTAFMTAGLKWSIGIIEAISLSIFVGVSVDYVLHVDQAFRFHAAFAHLVAGEAEPTPAARLAHLAAALAEVGAPVFAAAFTTFASAVFLLFCLILPFKKLGVMICAHTALSAAAALIVLPAVLFVVPQRRVSPARPNDNGGAAFELPVVMAEEAPPADDAPPRTTRQKKGRRRGARARRGRGPDEHKS
ncbi:hypothetical protein JL721_12797 [Aureococcus anophagefferens]|nr:hypothetical protein JL721_12797 [Aureococcus anophagefferens]